jgi:hypothetical protein
MAPPRRRTPRPIQHRPVLAALKAKPSGRRGRAGLDRHCARAASKGARRDEETLPRRTKKLDSCLQNPRSCAYHSQHWQRRIDRRPKQ